MARVVKLRRYDTGHIFAECGAVPRTVGNVTPCGRINGYTWSSLEAEGVVHLGGGAGLDVAEGLMVNALRAEGFDVQPTAEPTRQAIECAACDSPGRPSCTSCHGTGRVWPDGGVLLSAWLPAK